MRNYLYDTRTFAEDCIVEYGLEFLASQRLPTGWKFYFAPAFLYSDKRAKELALYMGAKPDFEGNLFSREPFDTITIYVGDA